MESISHNFNMRYIILPSHAYSCEALYNIMPELLMELTIQCLLNDYYKMIFPNSCKAYFKDLEFGDLIDNQNHDIHVIGSQIIPNLYVLF